MEFHSSHPTRHMNPEELKDYIFNDGEIGLDIIDNAIIARALAFYYEGLRSSFMAAQMLGRIDEEAEIQLSRMLDNSGRLCSTFKWVTEHMMEVHDKLHDACTDEECVVTKMQDEMKEWLGNDGPVV